MTPDVPNTQVGDGGNVLSPSGGQQSELNPLSNESLSQEMHNAFEKIDTLTGDLGRQEKIVKDTQNIVYLGFIVLIAVVGGLILSAVLFEIQTLRDNHQQNTLLQQQVSGKVNKQ